MLTPLFLYTGTTSTNRGQAMKTSKAVEIFMGYQKANSGEKNDQEL
jgi:hypothetical protein